MKLLAVAILAVALSGCASIAEDAHRDMQRITAGAIGCPPAEIVISDHQRFTWNATCRGRTFVCSFLDTVQCREAIARPQ